MQYQFVMRMIEDLNILVVCLKKLSFKKQASFLHKPLAPSFFNTFSRWGGFTRSTSL